MMAAVSLPDGEGRAEELYTIKAQTFSVLVGRGPRVRGSLPVGGSLTGSPSPFEGSGFYI